MTLQDDEDEDFPESVYTLKDGIPAKSTLIALRLESGFLHFLSSRHSLVTSISELKKIEAHLMTS